MTLGFARPARNWQHVTMIRPRQLLLFTMAIGLPVVTGYGAEPQRWVFEGLLTEASPSLAPQLVSGWVLSGSFDFSPLEVEEDFREPELRSGRMTGGISRGELTVDLYYQVKFQAVQGDGMSGFDFQNDHPEEDGRDLLGWFFPMQGELGTTGWTLEWLQVWLSDPAGKMITHLPVQIPPSGLNWKTAWFRLTFANEQGKEAYADGLIKVFSPESNLDAVSDAESWYAVAADLSTQLVQRDATILSLREELDAVRIRMEGLQRMVDLLVEERSSLQEENLLLSEQAEAADPEVLEELAALTAEKSILEDTMVGLTEKADSLQLRLAASENERLQMEARIAELEAARVTPEVAEQVSPPPPELQVEPVPEPLPSPPVPVVEMEPEDVFVEQVEPTSQPEESDEKERFSSIRRRGPRKFR